MLALCNAGISRLPVILVVNEALFGLPKVGIVLQTIQHFGDQGCLRLHTQVKNNENFLSTLDRQTSENFPYPT